MSNFTRESQQFELPIGFDNEALVAAARAHRDEAIADFLSAAGRGVASLWRNAIVKPYKSWQQREQTIRELSMLNEYELHDLGITHGMIPHLASGKFNPSADAANENDGSRKAA